MSSLIEPTKNAVIICPDNDVYPSVNSLFGCDFTLADSPSNGTGLALGLELVRSEFQKLSVPPTFCIPGEKTLTNSVYSINFHNFWLQILKAENTLGLALALIIT